MDQYDNDGYIGLGVAITVLCCVTIAAVIQSGKPVPGLPNTRVLKSAVVRRVVKFHIWIHLNTLLALVLAKSTFILHCLQSRLDVVGVPDKNKSLSARKYSCESITNTDLKAVHK